MFLEHIAAIFFFSGPVFYIGLFMMIDPASVALVPELTFRALQQFHRSSTGTEGKPPASGNERAGKVRRQRLVRRLGLILVACDLMFGILV